MVVLVIACSIIILFSYEINIDFGQELLMWTKSR